MDGAYEVTERGPNGEPRELRCATPGCTWVLRSHTFKSDRDPIFVAQFARHREQESMPSAKALGHLRRGRR